MADQRMVRNYDYMKVKTSTETPSSFKENPSPDSLSSCSSQSSNDWIHICPDCRRKIFESRSETSSDEEHESSNTYDSTWTDVSSLSDTTYSSSGSGYMSASSSLDDSLNNSDENSDTSRYYCDRSASSSSCSDTEALSPGSIVGNNTDTISLPEKERQKIKVFVLDREE